MTNIGPNRIGPNMMAAGADGTPYRPAVFEFAELLRAWDPRSPGDLDIPPSKDWSLVSWTCTPGKGRDLFLNIFEPNRF